ncbi:MAG TPA: nucleotidyltransferase domain-containing protein [Candidatus Woesebacteria bacterium]|nr:nucleotidyltransferase domain-containing protein [Candidatus Woesebacteria bacterium]
MVHRSAVIQTIAYSEYFSFPLSSKEIHLWLIGDKRVSYPTVQRYSPPLSKKDTEKRLLLLKNTQAKEKYLQSLISYTRHIPGIEMIAITGSVAVGNTKKGDDIDLLIITKPYVLWLIRPLFLLILSLHFPRRHPGDNPRSIRLNSLCPNLWLDTLSLTVHPQKQNLYTAHEVLQARPVFERGDIYQQYLKANAWTSKYLANAYYAKTTPSHSTRLVSRNFFLAPLNAIFFFLQYLYMLPKKTSETISLHSAYFHKNDLYPSLKQHLQNIQNTPLRQKKL